MGKRRVAEKDLGGIFVVGVIAWHISFRIFSTKFSFADHIFLVPRRR